MDTADVIVIGGGIVGSAAAWRLAHSGARVTLIDRRDVGHATAAGAGIIAPGTTLRMLPVFNDLVTRSAEFYPHLIASLAEDGETDTGYDVVGSLNIAVKDAELPLLDELQAMAEARRTEGVQGIGEISRINASEARGLFPALMHVRSALHVSGSARMDGRLMRAALQRAASAHGATIIEGDARLVLDGERVTHVEVNGERHAAGAVIIAGGAWSHSLGTALGGELPTYPQRGQILHLDMPHVDTSRWPIVLGFRSHYILTFPRHRVVAGATREHEAGYDPRMTAGGVHESLSEALRVAPGLADATLHEVRIGLRPTSPDDLPLLGRFPGIDNVFVATGHGPSGLQLGPCSGAAVADLALGQPVALDLTSFDPARFA